MDKKDWRILEAVYAEKNITKAAERLYISQPTLTYRLQQIEKNLILNFSIEEEEELILRIKEKC